MVLCRIFSSVIPDITEPQVISGAAIGNAKSLKYTQVNDRDFLGCRLVLANKTPETPW
jgi:hypothetical protein